MRSNIWSITVAPGSGNITVNITTDEGDDMGVMMHGTPLVMQGIVNALVAGLCIGELNGDNEYEEPEGVVQ
jgi:hypothetical protein